MKEQSRRFGHRPPAGYDPSRYERVSVACDVVILAFRDDRLEVLLIKRRHDPYQGYLALPGGFVEPNEPIRAAAEREVEEETGVTTSSLIPLSTYGDPDRDPRGRVISAAFLALTRSDLVKPRAGDDARDVGWFPLEPLPELAFDHDRIIGEARERLRELALMTPRLFDLLPENFAGARFFRLAREVMGRRYNESVFYEALARTPGFKLEGETAGAEGIYSYDRNGFHVGDFMFLLLSERAPSLQYGGET
jgi:8-oxo-dGTP diphosphatase